MREYLLVDAYNLFHAARASSHARLFPDLKRLAFFLEHYVSDSGSAVTLVIDGTRLSDEFVSTSTLRVLFSEPGQTADAVMEAWMARLAVADRLSWVLVSNDLQLCRMGSGMGLRVRSCASVVEDLARFANPSSSRAHPTRSTPPPSRKPFNNPFGRLASVLVLWALAAGLCPTCDAMEFSGFSQPDTAACDPASGETFVSNAELPAVTAPAEIPGQEKERGGFISKISGNGLVLVQRFIQSGPAGSGRNLREPRGLVVAKGRLYVSDGDHVRVYRTDTGTALESIQVAADPPVMLGPLVFGRKDEIYAADAASDRIFKIDTRQKNAVTLLVQNPILSQPRGLVFDPGTHRLLVVTRASGRLFQIDTRGRIKVVRKGLGHLSGLAVDSMGTVYLSSDERGEVYRIPDFGRGSLTLAVSGQSGAAGIAYDSVNQSVLVPLKAEGRLVSVPSPENRAGVAPKNART